MTKGLARCKLKSLHTLFFKALNAAVETSLS